MTKPSNEHEELQQRILDFWFGTDADSPLENAPKWFKQDSAFDEEIRQHFRKHIEAAGRGLYDNWRDTPEGSLAFIILTDQFPRNVYRGTPRAFAFDEIALSASLDGQANSFDEQLGLIERWFFYMPMEHAEDLALQDRCVSRFEELAEQAPDDIEDALQGALDYAIKHRDVIEQFARFPHRNEVLGRKSTSAEAEYLSQPGSGF
ncbi:MAG: DUF924 family protein [Myxococcota bacterium]